VPLKGMCKAEMCDGIIASMYEATTEQLWL
jgi:hypothetical protein